MTWINVVEFVKFISSKLGIRGYLLIGSVAVVGVMGLTIWGEKIEISSLKNDKVNLELKIKTLNDNIAVQTASIEKAAQEKKTLQTNLDNLSKNLPKTSTNYTKIVTDLNATPIPKDCPGAEQEVKRTLDAVVNEWNSKR